MSNRISISESEWQVMKIIWNDPPQTLQEILEKLKHTDWSKTTIQTYIARLVKKGALSTKRQGKGYLYYPAISESECQLAESQKDVYKRQVFYQAGHMIQRVQEYCRKTNQPVPVSVGERCV